METRLQPNSEESESILTVCLLAAFADGGKSEVERAAIRKIAEGLPKTDIDHVALYQQVLLGQVSCAHAAKTLERPELRHLAYEMAVCVCEADNILSPAEKNFLEQLRQVLQLDVDAASRIERDIETVAFPDFANAPSAIPPVKVEKTATRIATTAKDIDDMIINYAILTGALELMPQSLATLAIIPLQMKMVYRIGETYGYELDRGHIKEFIATAGVGLSSQVIEGYATKLFGGLFGKLAGQIGKSVANQATSSAMSFAATYAIGHMAQNYYSGGRTLSNIELHSLFDRFKTEASGLYSQYAADMQQKARGLDTKQIMNLVRSQ